MEKIVAMRYKFGKKEYLTQWAGYEEKDNTWEPLENLVGAVEEVRLFEDAQEKASAEQKKQLIDEREQR